MWKFKFDLIEAMVQKDCKSSLSALFDSQRQDFVQEIMPLRWSHYIPSCFFPGMGGGGGGGVVASGSMQARCLFSMLLPAAVVDGPVVIGRELPNKIQALRL